MSDSPIFDTMNEGEESREFAATDAVALRTSLPRPAASVDLSVEGELTQRGVLDPASTIRLTEMFRQTGEELKIRADLFDKGVKLFRDLEEGIKPDTVLRDLAMANLNEMTDYLRAYPKADGTDAPNLTRPTDDQFDRACELIERHIKDNLNSTNSGVTDLQMTQLRQRIRQALQGDKMLALSTFLHGANAGLLAGHLMDDLEEIVPERQWVSFHHIPHTLIAR